MMNEECKMKESAKRTYILHSSFCICPCQRQPAIDKPPLLGYTERTRALPVDGTPRVVYKEVTVIWGDLAVASLFLLSILFEQGDNRDYEHTECKKFHPCNHSISPPLRGRAEASPPNGGVPPTVFAAAPLTEYSTFRQKSIGIQNAAKNLQSRLTFLFGKGKIITTMCKKEGPPWMPAAVAIYPVEVD